MRKLCLILNWESCLLPPLEVAARALDSGLEKIQLRAKSLTTREFLEAAVSLKRISANRKVNLIVNDRLDIALASGINGLHLGQSDLPPEIALQFLKKNATLGLSVTNLLEVQQAQPVAGLTYLGFGPVFATKTKLDATQPSGVELLREAVFESRIPLIALGGINLENIGEVFATGVAGVAISALICESREPEIVTSRLLALCPR